MIFTPSPCCKLSHFLTPLPPLERDVLYGRPMCGFSYESNGESFSAAATLFIHSWVIIGYSSFIVAWPQKFGIRHQFQSVFNCTVRVLTNQSNTHMYQTKCEKRWTGFLCGETDLMHDPAVWMICRGSPAYTTNILFKYGRLSLRFATAKIYMSIVFAHRCEAIGLPGVFSSNNIYAQTFRQRLLIRLKDKNSSKRKNFDFL